MFDWVDVGGPEPILCPKCDAELTGWQTKSTGCTLTTVPWYSAFNFYTTCQECAEWVEYRRDEVISRARFDGYSLSVPTEGETE